MSRYLVVQEPGGTLCYVDDTQAHPLAGPLGPAMYETEASIIAFALNAVAEGRRLYALDHGSIFGDFWAYDGPTEGVAQ